MKTRARIGVSFALAATVLSSACSSDGDGASDDRRATDDDDDAPPVVIRSNTGLPGGMRGGVMISARRPATVDLDYLTGANGYGLRPELDELELPWALRGLGDIDGDGIDDIAIVTSERTYIVRGDGSRSQAAPDLATLVAERGAALDRRLDLVGLGDVNGDGIADFAWPTFDAGNTGARVVFGRADTDIAALASLPVDGRTGFTLVNDSRPRDVRTIAAAGDVDGDGLDDVLVGAFAYNGEDYDAPNAWVIYGDAERFPAVIDLAQLEPERGLALTSPPGEEQRAAVDDDIGTGYDARIAGGFDFDGDGLDDVAIGASTFDWIAREGALRTYVVYGRASRELSRLDMTALDGTNGVVIGWNDPPSGAQVDDVVALGDVNGDGLDDLSVIDAIFPAGGGHVIYGGAARFGPFLERSALPEGAGFAVVDPGEERELRGLARTGDIDGDGLDDVGVEYEQGAAILYGDAGARARVDLANPGDAAVSVLAGGDDGELTALGDVDGDGIDDLGIGWSTRLHDPGVRDAGDIDGDGIDDVEIVGSDVAYLSLIRVLYGFGPEGFVGVLPDPDGPRPLQRVDKALYAELVAAIELAARAPLDYLNTALANGTSLGPVATSCLEGFDGAAVSRFDCPKDPLPFAFGRTGGPRSPDAAGGRYARVATDEEGLQAIDYRSFPPSDSASGFSSPYDARFTFERSGELVLFGDGSTAPDAPAAPVCAIDTVTRLAVGDAELCAALIDRHVRALSAVFGPESEVGALRFEPER